MDPLPGAVFLLVFGVLQTQNLPEDPRYQNYYV